MNIAYATSDVEPGRQFEYWVDAVCGHCLLANCHSMGEKRFEGRLLNHAVGDLDISALSASQHFWSRKEPHLRRKPDDNLWLAYMRKKGKLTMRQSGREGHIGQGDIVFYDGELPFECMMEVGAVFLIPFPRQELLRLAPGAASYTAITMNDANAGALPLRLMLDQIETLDFSTMRPEVARQFGATVLELAALMLEFRTCETPPKMEQDIYARVLAYIQRRYQDPDICLETLAQVHQVSSRTISRAFARRQQTPMGMVWKARLDNSQQALLAGRSRTVTDAALDNGFSDISHFSRAFRKTFGIAPHELLQK